MICETLLIEIPQRAEDDSGLQQHDIVMTVLASAACDIDIDTAQRMRGFQACGPVRRPTK